MADNSSVELVRSTYDAFTKGDMDTVSNAFADDILWHNPGRSSISGTLHSKQEVFNFFGQLLKGRLAPSFLRC
jgi:ketosteroid isomerase-like protein